MKDFVLRIFFSAYPVVGQFTVYRLAPWDEANVP